MLTDTHCHLFYDQIKTDLDSVLDLQGGKKRKKKSKRKSKRKSKTKSKRKRERKSKRKWKTNLK